MSSAIAPGGTVLREVRVEGMMREGPKAALALARKLAARRIVVLGGEATIRSGGWARPLRRARYSVAQRVAQPLSAIIERGEQDGPDFMSELRAICPPALPGDLVILACTHYPAGLRAFEEAMPGAAIFDPVAAVVRGFAGRSGFGVSSRPGPRPPVLALTTGAPEAAARAASLAFGLRLEFGALRSWEDLDESLRGAAP
jgi:glutamate racemase